MDRVKRITTVREAIMKIAKILTDDKVIVTQAGVKAFVKYDEKTMKATRVNLPMIPDDATDELIDAVQGFLDSEISKVLYSDGKSALRAQFENMDGIYKPLESFFCEKKMTQAFPGSRNNLANMHQTFVDRFIEPKLKEAIANGADEQALFQVLAVPALRAWGGQQFFIDYMSDKWHLIAGIQSQLDPIASKMSTMTKPEQCYEMAREIRNTVMGEPPEGDGHNPFGDESEGGEGQPNRGGGGRSGGSGGGKGKSGGQGKKGAGKLDDDAEEEPGDDGGGGGGKPELEEPDDEDEDAEGEGEAEETEDDEDADDGAAEAPEKEREAGEGGGVNADSLRDQTATPPLTEDKSIAQEEYGGAQYMQNFDWDKIQDVSDEFGQYVTDLCSAETDKGSYTIFTREWDQVEPPKIPKDFSPTWITQMEDKIKDMIGPIARGLERAFAARNKSLNQHGRRTGTKMSAGNLYRLVNNDDHIYQKKIEHRTRDIAVSLVVDCSGSMHGSKIFTAMCSAWVMCEVLQRLGVSCEVIGFTTGDLSSPRAKELYREYCDDDRDWDRTEPLRMPIFKSFDERFGIEQKKRMASYPRVSGAMASNVDGESVQYAFERLNKHALKGKPKGRMMIVFSDGQPSGGGVHCHKLNSHLKHVAKTIEASGANLVGVGVMTDTVREFYRKNVSINNLEELPGLVLNQLRDALLAS